MKYDKSKAFPYPVLRPESDDFIDVDFQATVDLVVKKEKIEVLISYVLSSEDISSHIKNGEAEYVSIISCKDTYYQEILRTKSKDLKGEFSIGDLRGEVKIESFVVVKNSIPDFNSPALIA